MLELNDADEADEEDEGDTDDEQADEAELIVRRELAESEQEVEVCPEDRPEELSDSFDSRLSAATFFPFVNLAA